MEEPSAREIWEIDDTVIDLLVHDNQADQAPKEIHAELNPNRVQLIYTMDRYSRRIMAFRLSYEEEEMKSDQ